MLTYPFLAAILVAAFAETAHANCTAELLPSGGCPLGFVRFTLIPNYCYYFGDMVMTWPGALAYCKMYGANLADIHDMEEQAIIVNYIKTVADPDRSLRGYWLGGNNLGKRDQYIWTTTQHTIEFFNWASDEPSHSYEGHERCIHLNKNTDYMWNDIRCEYLIEEFNAPLCKYKY